MGAEEWLGSFKIISSSAILLYILKGTLFTIIISVIAVSLGIAIGAVMALLRNYANHGPYKILWRLACVYIEIFRNTPLLLWIFVCVVFCPVPSIFAHAMFGLTSVEAKLLFKAAVALTLFESGIIAEIIRGGLNSIPQGQFEAGYTQGFSIVQVMRLIILPQAFANVIPTLLSQVITIIKDSSFLANIATIELMARARMIMNSSNLYNGTGSINVSDIFVLYIAAGAIYFVINMTLSVWVRHMKTAKAGMRVQGA